MTTRFHDLSKNIEYKKKTYNYAHMLRQIVVGGGGGGSWINRSTSQTMRRDPYRRVALCCFHLFAPVTSFAPLRRAYLTVSIESSIQNSALNLNRFASILSASKQPPDDISFDDDDNDDNTESIVVRNFETSTQRVKKSTSTIPTRRSTPVVTRAPKIMDTASKDDYLFDDERPTTPPTSKRVKQTNMIGTSWKEKNQKFDSGMESTSTQVMSPQKRTVTRRDDDREDRTRPSEAGDTTTDRNFRHDFRGTRVFVQGIPPDVSWQTLKDHFKVAGEVVFASVSTDPMTGKSKGHGIVQYESTDMAKRAIKIMRDNPLNGAELYVREDVQEGKEGAALKSVSPGGGNGPTPPSTWKCADEAQLEYLAESEYKGIRALIKARDGARRRNNYEASDEMREQLKKSYGVQLDDRLKMWWISWDGKVVPENVASVKGEGRWGGLPPWRQIPTTPENDACVNPDLVNGLLKQRDIARKEKDFRTADALLEEAKESPGNSLQLRIHDESRTWRIWTDTPPPRPIHEIYGKEQEEELSPVLSAAEQCIAIVQANAPNKVAEVTKLLEQFPGREYNILKKIKQQYL